MIRFYNERWEEIVQCTEGARVHVARLMLSSDNRTCTVGNGVLENASCFPVPVLVLREEARIRGRIVLSGGWNPSGFFNLPSLYALHDWYLVRAGSAGTMTVQVGNEQGTLPVSAAVLEQNRVLVVWREVGKTRTLPVLLLKLRFVGDAGYAFKLYPEDVGTVNVEWIDVEPVGSLRFRADVGALTGNTWKTPLEIWIEGASGSVDVSTDAVVFTSTM